YTKKRISAKAEPLFQRILKEMPDHRPALLGLADLHMATGNYDAAEKTLGQVLKLDPQDTATRARLGIVHSRRGRPDLALPELEQVVERGPTQLEAKAELGSLYARGGDIDRAVKVLGDVLMADPRHPLALLYLGHAQYQRGELNKAAESFKASAKVDPNFAEPHYALGQLYEAQRKFNDAQSEYQRAANIQRAHPDAAAEAKRLASQPSPLPIRSSRVGCASPTRRGRRGVAIFASSVKYTSETDSNFTLDAKTRANVKSRDGIRIHLGPQPNCVAQRASTSGLRSDHEWDHCSRTAGFAARTG